MSLAAPPARAEAPRLDSVVIAAAVATLICAAPAVAVIVLALTQESDANFGGALIREGAIGTFSLVLAGGSGAIVFGALAAWLVTLCKFPGRALFEWLLVIPLAAPSYILAYAYASMTWAGASPVPVQGFWGAAFIYAVGLYPYVYLAARAAFASQSACALEAARMLGASPVRVFWRVALPLARPGLAAGAALACMEIAADYGAAQHFGLSTLSTAVFRAWYAHGAPALALQISAVLLVAAIVFLFVERSARGRARYAGGSSRWRPLPRYQLDALTGSAAFVFCFALITLGAALPLLWLARLAFFARERSRHRRPVRELNRSLIGGRPHYAGARSCHRGCDPAGDILGQRPDLCCGHGLCGAWGGGRARRAFAVCFGARSGMGWRTERHTFSRGALLDLRRALCFSRRGPDRCWLSPAFKRARRIGAHLGRRPVAAFH